MLEAHLDATIDALGTLVDGTRDDQLANATPCAQWTVRDLINHVVGGGHLFAAAFRGDEIAMPAEMPDLVGDNPAQAFKASIEDFRSSVPPAGERDRVAALPFGTMPISVALDLATLDLMTHCWDLAKATGQTPHLDAGAAEAAAAAARQMVPPEGRTPDAFGPVVDVPDTAPPLDRLVGWLGRDPSA